MACNTAGVAARTLQHITASPSKISGITRAALVLTHYEHDHIT